MRGNNIKDVLRYFAAAMASASPVVVHAEELTDLKSFQLEVQGAIAQHCAMGDMPNVKLGDLQSTARTRSARIALNCNIPIAVKVTAANGALANRLYPQGQGPYVGKLPYALGFLIPIRRPERGTIERSFSSAQLVAGQTFTSDDGIAIDGMQLRLDLAPADRDGPSPLLGGDYSETIEITIAPS